MRRMSVIAPDPTASPVLMVQMKARVTHDDEVGEELTITAALSGRAVSNDDVHRDMSVDEEVVGSSEEHQSDDHQPRDLDDAQHGESEDVPADHVGDRKEHERDHYGHATIWNVLRILSAIRRGWGSACHCRAPGSLTLEFKIFRQPSLVSLTRGLARLRGQDGGISLVPSEMPPTGLSTEDAPRFHERFRVVRA